MNSANKVEVKSALEATELEKLRNQLKLLEERCQNLEAELAQAKAPFSVGENLNSKSESGLREASTQSFQDFKILAENSPVTICCFDRQMRYTYVNSVVEANTGIPPEAYIGKTSRELGLAEEYIPLWESTIQQVFETGEKQVVEVSYPSPDGQLRYYQSIYAPQFATDGNGKKVESVLCIGNDITEIRRANHTLAEQERQFRTLVENSPDTISRYDRELRHVYISPVVEKRSGKSAQFFLGKTAQELGMPEAERARWEAVARQVFETGQPQMFEFKSWLGNQERYSQILLSPEFGENGTTVEYILGINRDITELKLAQRKVEEQERQYRTLIENSPDIITRYSPDFRVLYVNQVVERSTGLERQHYLGKSLAELSFPSDRISAIRKVFETGQPQMMEYTSISNKTGQTRYYLARVVPEFEADGVTISGVITIASDITQLKQSEIALAAEKERLDITLRSIAEGVVATDEAGRITLFNPRAETLTSCPVELALGQPFEKVVRLFDQSRQNLVESLITQVLEKGEMVTVGSSATNPIILLPGFESTSAGNGTLDLQNESGRENNEQEPLQKPLIEGRASPLYHQAADNRPIGVVFVFEDVSRRRKLEEELQKTDKLEAVGVLAGGIAHDFNNFLAAILGNLAFIRHSLSETNSLYKNLREAESACLQARSLTQQLLTFAKGGTPLKKDVAIGELLEDTTGFVLRGTSSSYEVKVAPDLWHAELDTGQISQVIYNLVLNAQQAMPEGGVVRIRATNVWLENDPEADRKAQATTYEGNYPGNNDEVNRLPAGSLFVPTPDLEVVILNQPVPVRPGPYLRIEVEDAGVGIPAKYLSNIFDPYFTTKQRGNGLGLSICYSIVKSHDGYITVKSEPGKGTTFTIYLPALLSDTQNASSKSNNEVAPSPAEISKSKTLTTVNSSSTPHNLRVLVMDDQVMILELLRDVLGECGHSVTLVQDGEGAVLCYQKALEEGQPFEVVIMDLTIPGRMGGEEAIKRLIEIDPQVKAIVSSGYSNDPITANYKEHGFKALLPKPFDIEELINMVEQLALSD